MKAVGSSPSGPIDATAADAPDIPSNALHTTATTQLGADSYTYLAFPPTGCNAAIQARMGGVVLADLLEGGTAPTRPAWPGACAPPAMRVSR